MLTKSLHAALPGISSFRHPSANWRGRVLLISFPDEGSKDLREALSTAWFEATPVDGISDVESVLARENPDVLLCLADACNIHELCAVVRKNVQTYHTPIVLVSGKVTLSARTCALEAGADELLLWDSSQLHAIVAQVRAFAWQKITLDELLLHCGKDFDVGMHVPESIFALTPHDLELELLALCTDRVFCLGLDRDVSRIGVRFTSFSAGSDSRELDGRYFDLLLLVMRPDERESLFRLHMRVLRDSGVSFCSSMLVVSPSDRESVSAGFAAGITEFLFLPMDRSVLRFRFWRHVQHRRYRRRLQELLGQGIRDAFRDSPTKMYNKRFLDDYLRRWPSCSRDRPLSLIFVDIDRFKEINDTHGHEAGNEALQYLAGVLSSSRAYDTAARYGGDEFVLVLPDARLEDAVEIANRFRKRVEEDFAQGKTLIRTISLGVAQALQGERAEELIHRADKALYRAKKGGRNQVAIAEE